MSLLKTQNKTMKYYYVVATNMTWYNKEQMYTYKNQTENYLL